MKTETKQLLAKVLSVHGGTEKMNRYQSLNAHIQIGGAMWNLKGHEGALKDVHYKASLKRQKGSWSGVFETNLTSEFLPERVSLLNEKGEVLESLQNPRKSFEGHTVQTPWSKLQLVYFSSYATWNYVTTPFHFLFPGVEINEIEPWIENGQTLRRLEVTYPDDFATHSKRQVYYFDENGYLKRHDYWPEVLGGSSATQIIEDYKEFDGIKMGTKRKIYILNDADNSYSKDPVLVSIDILDAKFES